MKKTKVLFVLTLIALLIWGELDWLGRQNIQFQESKKLNSVELKQVLEKSSSERQIQADVDGLFSRFGEGSKLLYDSDLVLASGLVRYAKALDGEVLGIELKDTEGLGVPCDVILRFGQHRSAQFILIFRTGADLSSLGPGYEKIANNIYLRKDPTSQP